MAVVDVHLVESAAAAGLIEDVGRIAAEVIERVYRVTTRRELGSLARPMPGAAPEFWPEDWRTFQGSDAYGWGATTANLLIRHLFGFKESRVTSRWSAVLSSGVSEADARARAALRDSQSAVPRQRLRSDLHRPRRPTPR